MCLTLFSFKNINLIFIFFRFLATKNMFGSPSLVVEDKEESDVELKGSRENGRGKENEDGANIVAEDEG